MGFNEKVAADLPWFFANVGETATFVPNSGDPVECTVILTTAHSIEPAGGESQTWEQHPAIDFIVDQIGRLPYPDETFVLASGKTAKVVSIIASDEYGAGKALVVYADPT